MDEFTVAKRAGAQIFRDAIKHIQTHGWHADSMAILLKVSDCKRWTQPMAVLMFSELSDQLKGKTLTQFDQKTHNQDDVTELFKRVADTLSTPS